MRNYDYSNKHSFSVDYMVIGGEYKMTHQGELTRKHACISSMLRDALRTTQLTRFGRSLNRNRDKIKKGKEKVLLLALGQLQQKSRIIQ